MSTNSAPKEYIILSGRTNPRAAGTTLRGVRQDKSAPPFDRAASVQPASLKNGVRSRQSETKPNRSQKPSTKRRTVPVQLWVSPAIKAELERLAETEQLSVSKVGGTLLEEAIRKSIHTQYGSLIQPIIEQAIKQQMRSYSTRLAVLLVRASYGVEQTRSLVTNILGRQSGMNPSQLDTILAGSRNTAKRNITRMTPQLAELVKEIETWLEEGERNG